MWLWRGLGFLFLAIGGVGVVLPVLPTTVFWIVAALCFARSDPKLRDWIYARPGFGPRVQTFIEEGALDRTAKRSALAGMTFAALLVGWLFWTRWWILASALGLIGIGALYVISRPKPA